MTQDTTNDPQAVAARGGIQYSTSPARAAELRQKIGDAVKYYEHTFSRKLSREDVLGILRRSVERDQERIFIKKVEPLSEADIRWFEAECGLGGEDEATEEQAPAVSGKKSGKKGKSGKPAGEDLNGHAEGEDGDPFPE